MSVLRNPVRVMKTLTAPTVTVLTAVLVNRDSLEMVQSVKVFRVFRIFIFRRSFNTILLSTKKADFVFYFFFHDIRYG